MEFTIKQWLIVYQRRTIEPVLYSCFRTISPYCLQNVFKRLKCPDRGSVGAVLGDHIPCSPPLYYPNIETHLVKLDHIMCCLYDRSLGFCGGMSRFCKVLQGKGVITSMLIDQLKLSRLANDSPFDPILIIGLQEVFYPSLSTRLLVNREKDHDILRLCFLQSL